MSAPKSNQKGATMVEFAITMAIFFMMVFGIISLALSYYAWNRMNEGARAGIRHLVVSSQVTGLTCPSASGVSASCSSAGSACSELMGIINASASFVEAGHVSVSYACSTAGSSSAPDSSLTRSVSLTISGVNNPFGVAALTGFGSQSFLSVLPAVTTTRISEDLYTP